MEKYQVWVGNDHSDLFDSWEDAFNWALENNGTEIEKLIWNSEESYNNYEPADEFEPCWSRDN